MVLVLLTTQCHQKLNASLLFLTRSRFNIRLHDTILKKFAWQPSDSSRCLLRTFPYYLVIQIFPRCVFLRMLSLIPLDKVGVKKGQFHYLQECTCSYHSSGPKAKSIYFMCCSLLVCSFVYTLSFMVYHHKEVIHWGYLLYFV